MDFKLLVKKTKHYYHRKGFLGTLKHIPSKLRWTIFRKPDILYICELSELDQQTDALPADIEVEKIDSIEQLSDQQIQALCEDQSGEIFTGELKYRFSRNSVLWLISHKGQPAGFFWTITGVTIKPHYFCLTEKDAHLYDGRILKSYRGRGLFSMLTDYILLQLKKESLLRAFVETNMANTAARHAFNKCHVKIIATARKYCFFGKNVTIWNRLERPL